MLPGTGGLVSSPMRWGNATASDYAGEPGIPYQLVQYFGQGNEPVAGRPQARRLVAKYFCNTTEEPAQADSVQTVLPAHEPAIVQTLPVTGGESDVLIQGANRAEGLAVGHSFRVQAQGTAHIHQARPIYIASAVAHDSGTTVDEYTGIYVDDPMGGSAGKITRRWSMYAKGRIQSERALWVGTFGEGSTLKSAAEAGATNIIVQVGDASKFTAGGTQSIVIGSGTVEEVKIISTVTDEGASGVKLGFSSGIANAHAIGEPVDPTTAANLRFESGRLRTDYGFKCGELLPSQVLVQNTNGTGYTQFPNQTSTVGTPNSGQNRLYFKEGKPFYKDAAGTEHEITHT